MDRFTEDEARRIFAEAARTSASTETHESGLSLEELQEIGRASGLDPAAVAAAAAGVRDAGPEIPTWHGVPLQTRRSRVVLGVLSDDVWAEAVIGLRREFKVQGVVEQIGRQRTWTHAAGLNAEALVTRVTVEAVEDGTRITAESGGGSERTAARIFGATYGMLALVFGGIGVATGEAVGFVVAGVMVAVTLVSYALLRFAVARRARTQPARFEAALDDVARLVASAREAHATGVSAAEIHTTEAPLRDAFLDLGDDAASDAADSPSRRTRA